MTYEIKDNPVHGKMLAKNGKIIITDHDTAMKLAERFNALQLVKAYGNRYMVQLPYTANSIAECECGGNSGEPKPETYNQYPDHEVQMARQELYRTAKLALMTHELLTRVGENQGLEGWVQSKLTRAADYIETVFSYLDYEMRYPTEMYAEADLNPGGSAQATPGTTTAGTVNQTPGQQSQKPLDGKNQTPGMVKMAKVDMNGKIQGMPIMVPQNQIKSKQQAGFHVIGESASAGASSAGGVASSMGFGNGFLNGGPGTVQRRKKKKKTTESSDKQTYKVTYGKPGLKGKYTGLKEAADKQEIVDYCTRKGLIFFDAQLKKSISESSDKKHGDAHDRGSADNYYGRKSDPHKYVDQPDGSRKRVKLTDPKEVAAYKAGYSSETGRKDYGEGVEEAQNKGLYANVNAKRERIKHGSGEHMRKSGEKGRPTAQAWKDSAKTAESESLDEIKQRLDAKCWTGKHKEGTKIKGGVRVNNCVPNESVKEAGGAAQQAAIAIAKKKSGKYDKDGKRIKEANYQGWVSNPQANLASRYSHDPDRAATVYKANKYNPETGLGGYIAPRGSNRDDTNIMVQLNNNLDSAYSTPLKFDDGSELKIGPGTARKALNKLHGMRPVQRHEAVKGMVASREAFVSFVKESNESIEEGWKSAAAGAALMGLGAMGAGGHAQAADMNKAGVTNMKAPVHATQAVKKEVLKRYPTDPRPDLELGSLEDMFFNGNTNHDREIRFLNYETDPNKGDMTPQQWSDAQGPKNSPMKKLSPDEQAARKKLPLRTANWTPDDDKMPATQEGQETGPKFTGYWKGKDKGKPGKKMVGSN